MGRRLFTALPAASLALCAATCALWARSYRAYDEVRTGVFGDDVEVSAVNGRVEVLARRSYRLRGIAPSAESDSLEGVAQPFDHLEDMTPPGRLYLSRQRWPIGRTYAAREPVAWLPAPAFRRRLDQVDRHGYYDRTVRARVPYGLAAAAFAAGPAAAVARRARRDRRAAAGRCRACGYDLRASPGRCPECGAEPRKEVAA